MKWLNELKSIESEVKRVSALSDAKMFDFNTAKKQKAERVPVKIEEGAGKWQMESPIIGKVVLMGWRDKLAHSERPKRSVAKSPSAVGLESGKLSLFEEWAYWYEERAGIAEHDGGLSRLEAEEIGRESIFNEAERRS